MGPEAGRRVLKNASQFTEPTLFASRASTVAAASRPVPVPASAHVHRHRHLPAAHTTSPPDPPSSHRPQRLERPPALSAPPPARPPSDPLRSASASHPTAPPDNVASRRSPPFRLPLPGRDSPRSADDDRQAILLPDLDVSPTPDTNALPDALARLAHMPTMAVIFPNQELSL